MLQTRTESSEKAGGTLSLKVTSGSSGFHQSTLRRVSDMRECCLHSPGDCGSESSVARMLSHMETLPSEDEKREGPGVG